MGDQPPAAVVNRMAAAFLETHGDIRRVLVAMVNSPEFFSTATYRAKVKTPQDFVVSAVRAAGSDVQDTGALAKTIAELGMPMWGHIAPDGYSMRSDAWNSTTALVSRMNFAMALASNRVQGVHTDFAALIGTDTAGMPAKQKQDLIEAKLLHVPVSARTEQLILSETTAPEEQQQAQLRQVAGVSGGGLRYGKGGGQGGKDRGYMPRDECRGVGFAGGAGRRAGDWVAGVSETVSARGQDLGVRAGRRFRSALLLLGGR